MGAPYLARFLRDVGLTDVEFSLLTVWKSFGVRAVESHIWLVGRLLGPLASLRHLPVTSHLAVNRSEQVNE
jgi:hypothetical protein